MRLERDIQEWINRLAGKSRRLGGETLSSVLRYDGSSLGREMERWVNRYSPNGGPASSRHRSAHEACRVLRSLVEPRFWSAGTNISQTPGEALFPDLVLEDEISGAFVIVELKRSSKTAREFATELLAYAHCLLQQHPGSKVFLVLVSTSWTPLERHAFAKLALGPHPMLPLEFREQGVSEPTPTLLVRSDLFPVADVESFPGRALQVHTKVFLLRVHSWRVGPRMAPWLNRIEHAVRALVHEAERGGASGFLLVWFLPHEVPSEGGKEPVVRAFFSTAVRNPCRQQEIPTFRNDKEAMEFAWSNNFEELADDTAVRLLLNLELGDTVDGYSPEHEGAWHDLRTRLQEEDASVLHFAPFGDIGDQVTKWRTQKRHALRPVVPDITALPVWHPLTWLSALESLIDSSDREGGDQTAWHAFRRGEDLGSLCRSRFGDRNFGQMAAQARFAHTWCDSFAAHEGAPQIRLQLEGSGPHYDWKRLDPAIQFAYGCVVKEGELASYCFCLGVHIGSDCVNVDYLVTERRQLHAKGIYLPQELEALVDDLLRRRTEQAITAASAFPLFNRDANTYT
jgi:hypothetical protein